MRRKKLAKNNIQPLNPVRGDMAQDTLFIDGLVHFLEIVGWVQQAIARREEMQMIHLAFLRRAAIDANDRVSFDRIKAATWMPRYSISRAAADLERRGLGAVRGIPSDKRWRRFYINDEGRKCIRRIDLEIARNILRGIGAIRTDSKRYYLFTISLYNLTRFFPDAWVRANHHPSDVDPEEKVSAKEMEMHQFMENLATEPIFSMNQTVKSAQDWLR